MKKKSFLLATTTGISMFLASCSTTCDSEGMVVLSNGYGLTKAKDSYYIVNPDSMKEFQASNLDALIKNKKAIKIDKERLRRINEITSSIEVLV
jgi:trehalose-6-phosphate synthase